MEARLYGYLYSIFVRRVYAVGTLRASYVHCTANLESSTAAHGLSRRGRMGHAAHCESFQVISRISKKILPTELYLISKKSNLFYAVPLFHYLYLCSFVVSRPALILFLRQLVTRAKALTSILLGINYTLKWCGFFMRGCSLYSHFLKCKGSPVQLEWRKVTWGLFIKLGCQGYVTGGDTYSQEIYNRTGLRKCF